MCVLIQITPFKAIEKLQFSREQQPPYGRAESCQVWKWSGKVAAVLRNCVWELGTLQVAQSLLSFSLSTPNYLCVPACTRAYLVLYLFAVTVSSACIFMSNLINSTLIIPQGQYYTM